MLIIYERYVSNIVGTRRAVFNSTLAGGYLSGSIVKSYYEGFPSKIDTAVLGAKLLTVGRIHKKAQENSCEFNYIVCTYYN